ncbi:MAG: thiamine ABC transporter substrate binding subunit [Sphaerochaetaceae bacterium]
MLKRYIYLILALFFIPLALFGRGAKEEPATTAYLTVYAYDSFVSEWGPGPAIVKEFEQKSGIKVNLVSSGTGGQLLTRLVLEKSKPKADVVIGITNELLHETYAEDLLISYESEALKDIPSFLHFDPKYTLLPFNYGNYAFVYDSQKVKEPPKSFDDLLDPKWKKSLILIDPRTSNVGMGLLQWTIAVYKEEYLKWWEAVKPNVLTIADGWSSGYGLFTQGEAPLVISYTTSPIYHIMNEGTERYQATLFDSGNLGVIEGAGILKSSKNIEQAKEFIDFLLTDAQLEIAVANVMYPVNEKVELPDAFDWAPKANPSLFLDSEEIAQFRDKWLNEWTEVVSR